jgi:hypothetical protein
LLSEFVLDYGEHCCNRICARACFDKYPGNWQSIPTVVSLIVAITIALDRVFRPREIWRNYDLVSAVIREEEMRYSTKTGDYAITKPEQDRIAFAKFVDRVEDAIARERV